MAKRKTTRTGSSRQRSAASLPNAELDVLACLWRKGRATASDIRGMLIRNRPMAHGSVVTLLSRLESKGFVNRAKGDVGKAFVYRAAQRPEPIHRTLVKDMLQRVFEGDPAAMLAALLAAQPPVGDQQARMRRLIDSGRRSLRAAR